MMSVQVSHCRPHIPIQQMMQRHLVDTLIIRTTCWHLEFLCTDEPEDFSHSVLPLLPNQEVETIFEVFLETILGSEVGVKATLEIWMSLDEVNVWVAKESIEEADDVELVVKFLIELG